MLEADITILVAEVRIDVSLLDDLNPRRVLIAGWTSEILAVGCIAHPRFTVFEVACPACQVSWPSNFRHVRFAVNGVAIEG